MLFSVGTRVKFLHSKDEGVVSALLSNGMVNVILDEDGMEIPAFIEDLMRFEEEIDENPSVKAKIIPGKQKKVPKRPEFPAAENQYAILKSMGIQLAFAPNIKQDATVDKYEMYLINDTNTDVLFELELSLKGRAPEQFSDKLIAMSYYNLGTLYFDDLNDSPTFDFTCTPLTTEGPGKALDKIIKVKPKQFFKQQRTAPLLNQRVHLYIIFDQLSPIEVGKNEDLQTYTKRNIKPKKWVNPHFKTYNTLDLNEVAAFNPEIDLHIEKLDPSAIKRPNSEIIRIQLGHCDDFLAKAIRLGVERVFLIHGVGKGRLRDAIASRLIQMPEVTSFKNEYHPRYGYGATEVIFN